MDKNHELLEFCRIQASLINRIFVFNLFFMQILELGNIKRRPP